MAKSKVSKGSKGHKASTSGSYTPGDIAHVPLSDSKQLYDHPARALPDPQGGGYWGDSNQLSVGGMSPSAGLNPGE